MKTFLFTLSNNFDVVDVVCLSLNVSKHPNLIHSISDAVLRLDGSEEAVFYKVKKKVVIGTFDTYFNSNAVNRVEVHRYKGNYIASVIKK